MFKRFLVLAALLLAGGLAFASGPPTSEVVDVWSTAKGTSTNILSRDLKPGTSAAGSGQNAYDCTYRITIALVTTSAVLNMHVTQLSDSSTQDFAMNSGTSLTAGNLYSFTFGATAPFSYNFRVGTATTIGICTVERLGY